ncbi:MAG: class I tRNA ligase family protein [Minisyncoccia bacterium]
MEKSRIFLTTPIYYVNDKPHIGHAFSTLVADVLTRYFRQKGKEVFFLTGTDEHGSKIYQKSQELKKNPQQFCDEISFLFKEAWKNLGIEYDYFIRTTDKDHIETVKYILEFLKKKDDLYEKNYEGLYCVECENFVSEKDLVNGLCPFHKKPPIKVSEKNFFFRLEKYLDLVFKKIKEKKLKITPESAYKETIGLIKQKLTDFSVSRLKEKVQWGIDIPFDNSQVVYVWVDALINYISAIGFYTNKNNFKKWWEESYVLHILGKDILKFHAIYWPAILQALGVKIPNEELIHGFFTVNGQKMSKTMGNVIDPNDLVKVYGEEATRYLLLSQFPISDGGDIKENQFKEKYNADLANSFGNLVSRVVSLVQKANLKERKKPENNFRKKIEEIKRSYSNLIENYKLYEALKEIFQLIDYCNLYLTQRKTWELIGSKETKKQLEEELSNLLFALEEIKELIYPFLPKTSKKMEEILKTLIPQPLFKRL